MVTSPSHRGYAMRATERDKMQGAIIGKALQNLYRAVFRRHVTRHDPTIARGTSFGAVPAVDESCIDPRIPGLAEYTPATARE